MTATTNTHSAQYVSVVSDGYDLDCLADFGATGIALAAMTPGVIVIETLQGHEIALPSAPPAHPWNVQINKVKGSDARTTAQNICVFFNKFVNPKPEAWVELPADGYTFTNTDPTTFTAKIIRPELLESAKLYNSVDGYWADMTLNTTTNYVSCSFAPDSNYTNAKWYVLLIDKSGRSIKSKNELTISATTVE